MDWIALVEKETDNSGLELRLRAAAVEFRARRPSNWRKSRHQITYA
jgi:hypothetical protein